MPSNSQPMDRRDLLKKGLGAGALFALPKTTKAKVRDLPDKDPLDSLTEVEREMQAAAVRSFTDDERLGTHQMVWSVHTSKPYVALTFDDGPDPEFTPQILRALHDHDVKASFMMLGYNVLHHQPIVHDVVSGGHEIGNHTMNHINLSRLTEPRTRKEMLDGAAAIKAIAGYDVKYFRPPRGAMTGSAMRIAAEQGWTVVLWSATRGAESDSDKEVAHAVGAKVRPGDIIDMHDGIGRATFYPNLPNAKHLRDRRRVEVAALPSIIERIKARGLEFVTISQLLAAAD